MACTGEPAVGVLTKVIFEPGIAPYIFDINSERYEFLMDGNPGENFQRHGRLIGGQGITGKMYRLKSRRRRGGYTVYGRIIMNPSAGYFSTLLKYLVGSDDGGGVFIPGNCLNKAGVLFDRDGYLHEFQDGICAHWVLQGSGISFRENGTPDLLTLTMDWIFKDDKWDDLASAWPNPEPELQSTVAYTPYMFQDSDGQFTIEGKDREVYGFRLEVTNKVKPRWANSFAMSSMPYAGKIIKLGLQLPWTADNADLYEPSDAGAECVFKFDLSDVGGDTTYTEFKITNLKIPEESPYASDEYDLTFENEGEAFGDESTDTPEIVVTNVINPARSPSHTASHSPSFTPSASVSRTPSATKSRTPSSTRSSTPSYTESATPSSTESSTPSSTASATPSATASHTPSSTPSATASRTPSATESATESSTPSATPSHSPSASGTPSSTASRTPSSTPSTSPSSTVSSTPSTSVSSTPSTSVSATPSTSVSSTPSTSVSNTPSATGA
jgi:hypothetical protein